jgi:hypothetical protein
MVASVPLVRVRTQQAYACVAAPWVAPWVGCARIAAIIVGLTLAGCQQVGPESIRQGELRYNATIAETQKKQIFTNLVRVHEDEPTYFMDIIEVDASVLATAGLTGGLTGTGTKETNLAPNDKNATIGVFGGNLGGTLTYSENPIIRYQPLQGAALIEQIVAPITVDSIAYLFDSEWPVAPILAFAVDRLTPGYEDFASAFGAIAELYDYGALTIAAGHSELAGGVADTKAKKPTSEKAAVAPAPTGPDDTIFLYLQINNPSLHDNPTPLAAKRNILRLWARLLQIYQGTQPENPKVSPADFAKAAAAITDEQSFAKVYAMLPNNRIELRTAPLPPQESTIKNGYRNIAPVLRTRSALGALRWSIQQYPPYIDFVTPEQLAQIRSHCWNQGTKDFYVLDPDEQNSVTANINTSAKNRVRVFLETMQSENRIQCRTGYARSDYNTNTVNYAEDINNPADTAIEKELNELRRYILVVVTNSEPVNAYVSAYDDKANQWLSIAPDDIVSQRNFNFMMQLLVMQAVAPAPPLNPSISVGGR